MNLLTLLTLIDDVMYFPILIIIMSSAGIYFTLRTRGVQIRLFFESIRLLFEHSDDKNSVSSLQAMLVSTASRVGTGNIIGVSTAICLGGPGAVFGCGLCALSEHLQHSLKAHWHRYLRKKTKKVASTADLHIILNRV